MTLDQVTHAWYVVMYDGRGEWVGDGEADDAAGAFQAVQSLWDDHFRESPRIQGRTRRGCYVRVYLCNQLVTTHYERPDNPARIRQPAPAFVRALRGTAGPHAEAAKQRRVSDNRSGERDAAASALYDQLRELDNEALWIRAGLTPGERGFGRQTVIAMVITKELPR